jgi:hypothetical protein
MNNLFILALICIVAYFLFFKGGVEMYTDNSVGNTCSILKGGIRIPDVNKLNTKCKFLNNGYVVNGFCTPTKCDTMTYSTEPKNCDKNSVQGSECINFWNGKIGKCSISTNPFSDPIPYCNTD